MTLSPPAEAAAFTLRVAPTLEGISEATEWLGALFETEGWPDAMRFGLELSLEEALTNVVSYAFQGGAAEPEIRIACFALSGGRIAVRLSDNGVPFDPTQVAEPEVPDSVEDARIGGHGVQLMRHFLESLSYARVGAENQLTLVAAPRAD